MQTFQALDTDGNGVLSKEELAHGFVKVYGMPEDEALEQVRTVMKQLDANKSNFIDFTEFVVAVTDTEKLLSRKRMEQAFQFFDIVRTIRRAYLGK